ncbi:MAG: hypothetical protein ACTHJ3_02605 [Pararhizobium sp.]
MTPAQTIELLDTTRRIAEALEALVKGASPAAPRGQVPTSPYVTPEVPDGFDTVLGYLVKNNPECLDYMDDPATATMRDGFWLTHQSSRRSLPVVKVPAPAALGELGITEVNAYAISLLEERLA